MFFYLLHSNRAMAFIIHAFSIFNDQNLRTFVRYAEFRRNLVADVSIRNKVKEIKIGITRYNTSFQSAFRHGTDAAAGTMLKNNLCPGFRLFNYFLYLTITFKLDPIHYNLYFIYYYIKINRIKNYALK